MRNRIVLTWKTANQQCVVWNLFFIHQTNVFPRVDFSA